MKAACWQSAVCRGLLLLLQRRAPRPAPVGRSRRHRRRRHSARSENPETASPYDALPEAYRLLVDKPFSGDFDAMVKRRAIRVAVTFNRTHYFIDKGQERGIDVRVVEAVRERSERGPEDRQPQGARGDRADVARSAVLPPSRAARWTWSPPW